MSSSGAAAPVIGSPLALSGASAPASVALVAQATASGQPRLLATGSCATNNMSVFTLQGCTAQFNKGFNAGFNPGYRSGFNSDANPLADVRRTNRRADLERILRRADFYDPNEFARLPEHAPRAFEEVSMDA